MSEHVFAARMAAQLGCSGAGLAADRLPDRLRVATAKARCSEAALVVSELAHAIHGAIGFTAEYDLQLYTRRLHAWRQAAGTLRSVTCSWSIWPRSRWGGLPSQSHQARTVPPTMA